jgi:hypothetical protein
MTPGLTRTEHGSRELCNLSVLYYYWADFYVRENFQVSIIKKMFHKGPLPNYVACQKWRILFLDIFQRNLAHL